VKPLHPQASVCVLAIASQAVALEWARHLNFQGALVIVALDVPIRVWLVRAHVKAVDVWAQVLVRQQGMRESAGQRVPSKVRAVTTFCEGYFGHVLVALFEIAELAVVACAPLDDEVAKVCSVATRIQQTGTLSR
jgi:hypothetical protein